MEHEGFVLWFTGLPCSGKTTIAELVAEKFKAHGMGLTLCSKNLQGMMTRPFCRLCARIDNDMGLSQHLQPNALEAIQTHYKHHLAQKIIPRWDKPGGHGGSW